MVEVYHRISDHDVVSGFRFAIHLPVDPGTYAREGGDDGSRCARG